MHQIALILHFFQKRSLCLMLAHVLILNPCFLRILHFFHILNLCKFHLLALDSGIRSALNAGNLPVSNPRKFLSPVPRLFEPLCILPYFPVPAYFFPGIAFLPATEYKTFLHLYFRLFFSFQQLPCYLNFSGKMCFFLRCQFLYGCLQRKADAFFQNTFISDR